MSANQLKREHFTNGKEFSKEDFEHFLNAARENQKSLYTRYLPSLAGGLAVSLLFSRGMGGAVGNFLAVACIFAGLILGGILTRPFTTDLRQAIAKLGVTNAEIAAARRRAQTGTVAWSEPTEPNGSKENGL